MKRLNLTFSLMLVTACASGEGADPGDSTPALKGCVRTTPTAASRERILLLTFPFSEEPGQIGRRLVSYRVTASGQVGGALDEIELRTRPSDQKIIFTPDGRHAIVVMRHSTDLLAALAVVAVGDDGGLTFVEEAFETGDTYPSHIFLSPDGTELLVADAVGSMDPETLNGSLRRVDLDCDGNLVDRGIVMAGNSINGLQFNPADPSRVVIIANQLENAGEGHAHLFDWSTPTPTWLASASVWPDDDAIPSSAAFTPDGDWLMIADDGLFTSGRLSVVSVGPTSLAGHSVMALENPTDLVASPYNDSLLVVQSNTTDAYSRFTYDAGSNGNPFTATGDIGYVYGAPSLPTHAQLIEVGELTGRVYVTELHAVRQLSFTEGGAIVDDDQTTVGYGVSGIVGTLGIQP